MGRRLYFVFEVEEDEEKTHETTGIGVIEGVPMFYTAPRALCVCTMYKSVYGGAIYCYKHYAIFSIINLMVFCDYGDSYRKKHGKKQGCR